MRIRLANLQGQSKREHALQKWFWLYNAPQNRSMGPVTLLLRALVYKLLRRQPTLPPKQQTTRSFCCHPHQNPSTIPHLRKSTGQSISLQVRVFYELLGDIALFLPTPLIKSNICFFRTFSQSSNKVGSILRSFSSPHLAISIRMDFQ